MNRTCKTILSLGVVLAVTACLSQRARAQAWAWTNDMPASFVIGQAGFGMNGTTATATGLYLPAQGIIDPATGKVFVSDQWNNRVLRYPSTAAMMNGAAAEAVIGQTDFVSVGYDGNTGIVSAAGFQQPSGIALDASGTLWVADEDNSRLLCFPNAATIPSGTAASKVLGEPDFVTVNYEAVSSSQMYQPIGVFCKGTTVWVADWFNCRVLRFNNAASKANGAPADAVFGEPDFNTGYLDNYEVAVPSATQLYFPTGIYVDGADNLWVADEQFNRVLMFPNATTAVSGEAATKVLGQPGFLSDASGTTASSMSFPAGVYGDVLGDIYVTDFTNNRVLIFENAASLPNGSPANIVLAQPDFVSNGSGDGANQVYGPELLFIPTSGTSLLVDDYFNNRVMVWVPIVPLPLALISFTGQLEHDGQVLLQWQISGDGAPSTGQQGYTELEYSTNATSGFTDVLDRQPINFGEQSYSYRQVSPAAGANYYRLKLIQPDGSVSYSEIVLVVSGGPGSMGLSIYPNPAQSSLVIKVPEAGGVTAGTAEIDIYNSAGMLMQRLLTSAAVNNIDISRFAAGVYIARVVQGGNTVSGSFVKAN
jgi:sugar lactone lactonase YvrE